MLYIDTAQRPAGAVYVEVLTPVVAQAFTADPGQESVRADLNPGPIHAATTIRGGPAR